MPYRVSISLFILYRVEKSRDRLTFHAIHWQDRLAEAVGVDTRRYRTLAFVIASFFAGSPARCSRTTSAP